MADSTDESNITVWELFKEGLVITCCTSCVDGAGTIGNGRVLKAALSDFMPFLFFELLGQPLPLFLGAVWEVDATSALMVHSAFA
ncbi:MAG: hypothetical protein ACREHG_08125, partial [Candidatus Saccharimonadales bacterium]